MHIRFRLFKKGRNVDFNTNREEILLEYIAVSQNKTFMTPAKNEDRPSGTATNVGNASTGFILPSTGGGPRL